jgi:hypothetical protein
MARLNRPRQTRRFKGATGKVVGTQKTALAGAASKLSPAVLSTQQRNLDLQPTTQARQAETEVRQIVTTGRQTARKVVGNVESAIDEVALSSDAKKRMLEAVRFSHDMWKLQAHFQNISIMAVSAIGAPGCLTGPELEPWINQAPEQGAGEGELELRRAVAAGVSDCFAQWQDHVTVPGLPWYPAFAAYPGPTAPPMPNIPVPIITCPSARGAKIMSPAPLVSAMRDGLSDPVSPDVAAFLDSIARSLSLSFSIWLAAAQVMLVMGTGPVPTFAPPYVPVGPVVGGDVLAAPGHLSASPPLTVLVLP